MEACAVDSFRHLFALAAEFCWSPRVCVRAPERTLPPRVELGETRGAIDLLLSGRPCIMVTGHCGNWEMLGAGIASLGVKVSAVYRPLNQRQIDQWVRRTRSARGLMLIDKFGAAERMMRLVDSGESVGFTADQNAGNKGVFVPFFDRLASSYKSIGLMALQNELPMICGHAVRLGGIRGSHLRYRIEITDVIDPADWVGQPDPLFYVTARYRRAIEEMVRRAPDQYLWMHGAWKTRAPHERRGAAFPASLREKIAALPWVTAESLDRLVDRSERDACAAGSRTDGTVAARLADGHTAADTH